jgi:translation initiation factor 2B subunit (eIF-2B alpha/beta/delta family)
MEYKDVCGEIISLPPQGVATTSARIRNLTIEGAEELAREMNKIIQEFLSKIRKS